MRQPHCTGLHILGNKNGVGTRGQTPRPLCGGMVGDEGSDPLSPTPFFSLLPLLCQLPACLSSEIFSFRDQLKRLRHLWVALEENAAGVRYAEAVVNDFIFDGPLNVVLVVLKILLG